MCAAGRRIRKQSSSNCRAVGALKRGQIVVDVGVGTGLSAEPFLRSGYTVIGVEPNEPMRLRAINSCVSM